MNTTKKLLTKINQMVRKDTAMKREILQRVHALEVGVYKRQRGL